MLCLPGLTPVANDAHAVGDSGECVVAERIHAALVGQPLHVRQLAFASSTCSTSAGSMPSKPRMTSRCEVPAGRPAAVERGRCVSATDRHDGDHRDERGDERSFAHVAAIIATVLVYAFGVRALGIDYGRTAHRARAVRRDRPARAAVEDDRTCRGGPVARGGDTRG